MAELVTVLATIDHGQDLVMLGSYRSSFGMSLLEAIIPCGVFKMLTLALLATAFFLTVSIATFFSLGDNPRRFVPSML